MSCGDLNPSGVGAELLFPVQVSILVLNASGVGIKSFPVSDRTLATTSHQSHVLYSILFKGVDWTYLQLRLLRLSLFLQMVLLGQYASMQCSIRLA